MTMHRPTTATARRAFLGASLLLGSALLSACATGPIAPPHEPGSPTGGMNLAIWYARPDTRQYEYFVLSADGVLKYGGGMTAFDRKTEWSGPITAEQGAKIRSIVDEAGWMTAKDPNLRTAPGPIAEITVAAGKQERQFSIVGPNEPVVRIAELLQQVADQRFDREMRSLPEAGVRKQQ